MFLGSSHTFSGGGLGCLLRLFGVFDHFFGVTLPPWGIFFVVILMVGWSDFGFDDVSMGWERILGRKSAISNLFMWPAFHRT